MESIHRRFTKQVMSWSESLTYKERRSLLAFEPFWLHRRKSRERFYMTRKTGIQPPLTCLQSSLVAPTRSAKHLEPFTKK